MHIGKKAGWETTKHQQSTHAGKAKVLADDHFGDERVAVCHEGIPRRRAVHIRVAEQQLHDTRVALEDHLAQQTCLTQLVLHR